MPKGDAGDRDAAVAQPAGADRAAVDSAADTEVAGRTELASGSGTAEPVAARSAVPDSSDSLIGITLQDRYQITRKIGQGGMGAVFEARHMEIGKRVAVKVLLDKYAEKDQVVARLKQEARLASSIGHSNIIDITDFGRTIEGQTFVVMEFLEGESLGACIGRTGPLDQERAIRIARQITSALTAAHEKGIVHRDVKPENVFLLERDGTDFVKVVDFGISKSIRADELDGASPRLTQTGMVLGTPLYMSPEQARGDETLDERIDVYAVGVLLYEMVTGEVPFRGKNYLSVLSQVMSEEPRAPSELRPDVDRNLEAIIYKAMAKDRDERYASMAELDADLAVLIDPDTQTTGARITAARWRRRQQKRGTLRVIAWVAGLAVLAAAVAFAVVLTLPGKSDETRKRRRPEGMSARRMHRAADAAPAPRAEPTATIHIVTQPEGATLYHRSRLLGTAPLDFETERTNEKVTLRAELDGYQSGEIVVHPLRDDGATITGKLDPVAADPVETRPRERPRPRPTPKPDKPGPSTQPDDTGDLMGNPHKRQNPN